MTYAIIEVGGKQYRVREGEQLLVDRLNQEDGATFTPSVLLVGGDDAPVLDPSEGAVTAKVLGQVKGPKIRIGKYKKRTGYRRHTGFRASLTRIEIESIGEAKSGRPAKKKVAPKAAKEPIEAAAGTVTEAEAAEAAPVSEAAPAALPEGYAELTIADLKKVVGAWDSEELEAALAYEHEHGKRKGAITALEGAIARKEGES